MTTEEETNGRDWSAATWVVVVLALGLTVGALLARTVRVPAGPTPTGMPAPPLWWSQLGVILSSTTLALLLALLVVYVRAYLATRAAHTLGLALFLAVLFVESTVNSPLLFTAFGQGPGALGRFLDVGGFLMTVALTIFLYLSLQ